MAKILNNIVNDTLKKNGKWSRTSLTMFTAWLIAIYMALYNMYKVGFNFDVFVVFTGVALGAKVTDAWSTKLAKETKETTNTETI